jgi:hypothetical protein
MGNFNIKKPLNNLKNIMGNFNIKKTLNNLQILITYKPL